MIKRYRYSSVACATAGHASDDQDHVTLSFGHEMVNQKYQMEYCKCHPLIGLEIRINLIHMIQSLQEQCQDSALPPSC